MSRPGAQTLEAGAQAIEPDTASPGRGWAIGGRNLNRLWASYWERRTRRATMAILRSLDDRTLKDLGLHRSEIGSLVYGTRRDRRI